MNSALKIMPRRSTKSGQSHLFEAILPHWELPTSILVLLASVSGTPVPTGNGLRYDPVGTLGSASTVYPDGVDWDHAIELELSKVASTLLSEGQDMPSDAKAAVFERLWELYD